MDKLYLAKPTKENENDAIKYIEEFQIFNSNINGTGGLDRYLNDYDGWLKKLEEDEIRIPSEERVPAITRLLVREEDNRIIGMINIRLVLNERLKKLGGSIGYSIRPTERRQGYSKINLYLGLLLCKKYNIKEVQIDCDEDNIGSKKTIEALGGVLNKSFYSDLENCMVLSYIIDVDKVLNEYSNIYEPLIRVN